MQRMVEEVKEHGRAHWKELRKGAKSRVKRILVKSCEKVLGYWTKDNETIIFLVDDPRPPIWGQFFKKEDSIVKSCWKKLELNNQAYNHNGLQL